MADSSKTTQPAKRLDDRTDSDLLQAIARHEEEALESLFEKFGGRVLAYVRTLGGQSFPAEDAVQEVFLTLWQKAALFSTGAGSAEAWIFTITRHKVFDILRAHRSTKEDIDPDLERWPVQDLQPQTNAEDTLSLQKALSMLPVEQQAPIRLAYMGGLTYEETARQLGVPLGTLKSRVRSGLGTLRTLLAFPKAGVPS
ncbi:MAG: sigma-70 family RNA polymerase sigma factor [Holophaga sp.]|nr:sigma-70 family RNA polymerase sigma factor [Holophaga sp.]